MEGFQALMQFLMMPMIFLSGALFPMRDLPSWMDILVKINPVTYAVDPLRRVVFEAQDIPEQVLRMFPQMGLGVEVFGHAMTIRDDVLVIGVFGTVMLFLPCGCSIAKKTEKAAQKTDRPSHCQPLEASLLCNCVEQLMRARFWGREWRSTGCEAEG